LVESEPPGYLFRRYRRTDAVNAIGVNATQNPQLFAAEYKYNNTIPPWLQ
jgi:hypothetical protein